MFCCMDRNQSIVCSYLEKLEIGITLVPKIKVRVRIHELLSPPLHLIADSRAGDRLAPDDDSPFLFFEVVGELKYRCLVAGPHEGAHCGLHAADKIVVAVVIVENFELDILPGFEYKVKCKRFGECGVQFILSSLSPAEDEEVLGSEVAAVADLDVGVRLAKEIQVLEFSAGDEKLNSLIKSFLDHILILQIISDKAKLNSSEKDVDHPLLVLRFLDSQFVGVAGPRQPHSPLLP